MDANRLIRLTVAGWLFLIAWAWQLAALGFNFRDRLEPLLSAQPIAAAGAAVIVGVATSPLIGFLISSITERTLRWYGGGDTQFDVLGGIGATQDVIACLKRLLPELDSELACIGSEFSRIDWSQRRRARKQYDRIMPYVNVVYHTRAPATLIDYTTRRWTLYWMYANSVCAIILGSALATWTAGACWTRSINGAKWLVEGSIVLFVAYSIGRLAPLREDISRTVLIWLRREAAYFPRQSE